MVKIRSSVLVKNQAGEVSLVVPFPPLSPARVLRSCRDGGALRRASRSYWILCG